MVGIVSRDERIPKWMCVSEKVDQGLVALEETLSKIHCLKAFDVFTLLNKLANIRRELSDKMHPFYRYLKLVILDGIAPLISPILGGGQTKGHSLMMQLGNNLKRLAEEFSLSVLLVNNVVSDWDSSSPEQFKPALGRSWKSVPHVRIFIRHLENYEQRRNGQGDRMISLWKSSRRTTGGQLSFSVDERGAISDV